LTSAAPSSTSTPSEARDQLVLKVRQDHLGGLPVRQDLQALVGTLVRAVIRVHLDSQVSRVYRAPPALRARPDPLDLKVLPE
jgi:hypothetical protein